MLSAGAERVRCLYRVPPAEVRAGGGPATALLEALRSLPEQADDEEQRQRARQAARGDTFEVCVMRVRIADAFVWQDKSLFVLSFFAPCYTECRAAETLTLWVPITVVYPVLLFIWLKRPRHRALLRQKARTASAVPFTANDARVKAQVGGK